MDFDLLNSMVDGKEWEDDSVHFCACGEEKNPSFEKCFMCSKKERVELDSWVSNLQYKTRKWPQEPF
jgi:hypothetical protein